MELLPCELSAMDCCTCDYLDEVTGECTYNER